MVLTRVVAATAAFGVAPLFLQNGHSERGSSVFDGFAGGRQLLRQPIGSVHELVGPFVLIAGDGSVASEYSDPSVHIVHDLWDLRPVPFGFFLILGVRVIVLHHSRKLFSPIHAILFVFVTSE